MNDFTKEELIEIEKAIYAKILPMEDIKSTKSQLVLKIQSMIVNYCEHEHLKDVGRDYQVCRGCGKEISI